ncbi:MAG: LPS-assembly protein LptD [Oleiphilaceae bacterium]|nr:LPS-assembly protein LptD [Oleiphilaceae bacterium]
MLPTVLLQDPADVLSRFRHFTDPLSRLTPVILAAAAILGASAEVVADTGAEAVSAAELDWRPRAELPESVREALPVFCEGGYLPPAGFEPEGGQVSVGPDSDQPLEATSVSARYQLDRELRLQGDVELRQGQFQVTGPEARYNQGSGLLDIAGPLVSRSRGAVLTGDQATYDLNSGDLDINSATFLFHETEMRGTAAHLSRPEPDLIRIKQGSLTTCAPAQRDWSLVASDIDLDQAEGQGTARNVRLEIMDVPVFYWPYLSFPIDDRRKSGFLYPAFGASNVGRGIFVATPYYLNLAPHYDATITPEYIHGRGFLTEAEGRYLSPWGETVLQVGFIDDDEEFRKENPGEDGRRSALDLSSRIRFGGGWQGFVDYAEVSDNDYLTDLNRNLDINEQTHLLREASVRYRDDTQLFETFFNNYQTITDRIPERSRPYDQLPNVIYGARYDWGGLETGLEGQYTYFYRDNEELTGRDRVNGQRLRLLPELALDMNAIWGYSRPSVTLDYTHYELEDYEPGPSSIDRTVPVFEWDNGLYFDRQSSVFDIPYNQTLEPRLYYAWADAETQDDIPDFDTALTSFSFSQLFTRDRFSGGDRVGDANQLTAAVTTRFNDLNTGAERARFSVGQIYFYDDREVALGNQGASDRSDSEIAGEAVLRPLETLDIRASGLWDPRLQQTSEGRSELLFHSRDYRYLASVGHTYRRQSLAQNRDQRLEQVDIGAVLPVTDHISLVGRWVHDAALDRTVGSLMGIEYNNCCWSLQLVSQNFLTESDDPSDTDGTLDNRIIFQIQLKGLGGGGGASESIADAIPGFEERERRRFNPYN